MQSSYAEVFTREMGCSLNEWHGWLPNAIGDHPWTLSDSSADIRFSGGGLRIDWQVGAPRVIALASIPRLIVTFTFTNQDAAQRYTFMRRFDLYMQRGGG